MNTYRVKIKDIKTLGIVESSSKRKCWIDNMHANFIVKIRQ